MRHLDYAPNLQMDNEVNTLYQFIGQQYARGIPKKEAPPRKPFGGYFDDFKRGKDHLALPSVYRHICVSPSWQYMYTYHFTRMHMHPLYYDGPKSTHWHLRKRHSDPMVKYNMCAVPNYRHYSICVHPNDMTIRNALSQFSLQMYINCTFSIPINQDLS